MPPAEEGLVGTVAASVEVRRLEVGERAAERQVRRIRMLVAVLVRMPAKATRFSHRSKIGY